MKHMPLEVRVAIDDDNPSIVRDDYNCIECGLCGETCANITGVHKSYAFNDTNNRAICINCGQCSNVCPTECISERKEYQNVINNINNANKVVIASTAPAVRVALGEEFGLPEGTFVQGKMVALLRKLGFKYVLDTNFAADLTICEEASELLERIVNKTAPIPQFTSCCPAWVKFCEIYHPELLNNLSTAKSPFEMQGPTIKTFFAKKMKIDPKSIYSVGITPCTAKKFEIRRPEMNISASINNDKDMRDMDAIITTRELAEWARKEKIDFNTLEDSQFDSPMGTASGAGFIFGSTGGVMEAALRTAYEYKTGKPLPNELLNFTPVRGYEGIKEATIDFDGTLISVAVVFGTSNAHKLIKEIENGNKFYHFIEVMACPGGCIGGGGQPRDFIKNDAKIKTARMNSIYAKDSSMAIRKSHENPDIIQVYKEFYGKPLSEKAEKMLHTSYTDRSTTTFMNGKKEPYLAENDVKGKKTWRCKVCGYIYEGEALPKDFVCPVCMQPASAFEEIK